MATIQYSDEIIATVSRMGHDVATLRFSGLYTLAELMRKLQSALGQCFGMVNVRLHNLSQGWTQNSRLMLKPQTC